MKLFTKIFLVLMVFGLLPLSHYANNELSNSKAFQNILNQDLQQTRNADFYVPPSEEGTKALGDDCSDPLVITLNVGDTYVDTDQYTCGRGNNYENSSYYEAGEEIVYKMVLNENLDLNISLDTKGTKYSVLHIYDDCPDVGTMLERKIDYTGSQYNINKPLMAGTYYITIDATSSAGCIPDFDIVFSALEVPEGDACFNPIDYGLVNAGPIDGNLETGQDFDWYSFTAETDVLATVSLCGAEAGVRLEIWADCGDEDYLYYNTNACDGRPEVTDIHMVAGQTYYAKVFCWSYLPGTYTLNITGEDATPRLVVEPDPLDMGEWPIGGWQQAQHFSLINSGIVDVEVNVSDIDNPDGLFFLDNPILPLIIPNDETYLLPISFVGEEITEGNYSTTYVVNYGSDNILKTADVSVYAYEAPVGDIFENPFEVSIPYTEAGVSTAFPMRSNYTIPGSEENGNDVVYQFSLDADQILDVNILNSTTNPKMAIYAANFNNNDGPMLSNALVAGQELLDDVSLFMGDYYLVVSAETDGEEMTFDLEITSMAMPAPECAINPTPADGAVEIPSNGIVLSWEYTNYVEEYQLLVGTDYPPTEIYMDWTIANVDGDSYELPNLDPSMQYFWQVNVRNNTETVECGVFGFTTTLTPPTNLTASVIEISESEYNVELNWSTSSKALLSYNVYRDGAFLATTDAGTTTYTDLDVAYNIDPCYEYNVEAIYDEGVSELSNIATACISGVGSVNGYVTSLQTGEPIGEAIISFISMSEDKSYTFYTDVDGYYNVEVLEDCYKMTVNAIGYLPETENNFCVDFASTTTKDFELDENPYPVSDVVATEVSDDKVHIQWGETVQDVSEWIHYDDGVNFNVLGGFNTFSWAIRFDPVQMIEYEGSSISKLRFYSTNDKPIHVLIMQGDNAEDLIYTQEITEIETNSWNEFVLSTVVNFDNTQPLWIGFHSYFGEHNPATYGEYQGEPYGDYINYDGQNWNHLSDFYVFGTWNIQAFVSSSNGKSFTLKKHKEPEYSREHGFNPQVGKPNNNLLSASLPITANKADKDILGYNIYRQSCDESSDLEFLGMTIDETFTDNSWDSISWGTYKWGVEVVYTNNESQLSFSNCLDKLMETSVAMEVNTNSTNTAEGCLVFFTNTSEPDLGLVYEVNLDESGVENIDSFRKGTYDILVSLLGFEKITLDHVLISSDTVFYWQLEEIIAPPADLYVTPTGFANWAQGYEAPFQPLFEDFETGDIPEGWSATSNASEGWYVIEGESGAWWKVPEGDGFYAVSNDDENNDDGYMDYLITPELNLGFNFQPLLTFDSYYTGSFGQQATVEVSFDGVNWEVVQEVETAYEWTQIQVDLIEYGGIDKLWIAFHSSDNNGWASGWAIDNVAITNVDGKSEKDLQFYKVWHNGVFTNDAYDTTYQYGINEDLVAGETYLSEVQAVFSNGVSEKQYYEWTYIPCDEFPGPAAIDAFNVQGTQNVVVNWNNTIGENPVEATILGTNIYRNDELIVYIPSPDTFYMDIDVEFGYHDYCVATVYSLDEGLHSWTSCMNAVCEEVLIGEECLAPLNLTAEDHTGDGYTATLNWNMGGNEPQEFRHDDGIATGQLGSSTGTTNTLLGNVHTVDAELTEMSWYLTAEGGPHNEVAIYVLGLDAEGVPDGSNVLFTESVSNTDEVWNTYTFDTPIDVEGGFFLGVGFNGFVAVGTDDGVDAPYEFEYNTHYYVTDYTAGGWEAIENYNFMVNTMVRAMGVAGSVASYPVVENNNITTGDLELISANQSVNTGEPKWIAGKASKELVGFNVYRDGSLVASNVTSMSYLDDVGVAGYYCYEVTANYEFCGESDPSNEACVDIAVGINEMENNLSVYPNPARDYLMVEATEDILNIRLTNNIGQSIKSFENINQSQYKVNTSELSKGVYYLEIQTTNQTKMTQFIRQE